MSQLTRQDVAEVVEGILERRLDRRFSEFEEKIENKLGQKLDEKLDSKLGAFIEHIDNKFDSLAEAIPVMNSTMGTLAKASDLQEVRQDIRTIKLAVRATNDDLPQWNRL